MLERILSIDQTLTKMTAPTVLNNWHTKNSLKTRNFCFKKISWLLLAICVAILCVAIHISYNCMVYIYNSLAFS